MNSPIKKIAIIGTGVIGAGWTIRLLAKNKVEKDSSVNRRTFFSWLSLGWVAFVAATGGFFTMMLRFFFPNVLFEPVQTFRAGFPDDYTVGEVDLRWKEKYGVWMVRNDEGIYVCLLYTSPSPRD